MEEGGMGCLPKSRKQGAKSNKKACSFLPLTFICNEKTKTSIQQFIEHPKAFPCFTFLIIP